MTTNLEKTKQFDFRFEANAEDVEQVRSIVTATQFFDLHEIEIAVELVEERLAKGNESGYEFIFAERENELAGYLCYGEIPCTVGSYDVYWVVVSPQHQRSGLGSKLMTLCEEKILAASGRQIYVETSGRAQYQSTRDFYLRCGYESVSELADFYAPGDSRIIYHKRVVNSK